MTPGNIPGFTDVLNPYPFITNYAITVNYTLSPTTFIEGTYGFIRNELAGGNEGGILMNDSATGSTRHGLADFPLLYPDAGVVDQRYYAYEVMQDVKPPFWDGTKLNLPPVFSWGGRIGAAPPNQRYPGWLNINRTQDVVDQLDEGRGPAHDEGAASTTTTASRRRTSAPAAGNLSFQGYVNFGNDTNNPLDTGFGYANAAMGVFTQYHAGLEVRRRQHDLQQHRGLRAGQLEGEQPLDPRLRHAVHAPAAAVRPVPADVELLPGPVVAVRGAGALHRRAAATAQPPARATPERDGPADRADPDGAGRGEHAGGHRHADPRHRAIRSTASGRRATASRSTAYTWPKLVVGPRFGVAYDLTGNQTHGRSAAAAGSSTTVRTATRCSRFRATRRSPTSAGPAQRHAAERSARSGLQPRPVPELVDLPVRREGAGLAAQWQAGVQMALPWASSLDVSYVGNHGYNRLGGFQGGTTVNLNAVDFGAAYLPQNQDPTQAPPGGARRQRLYDEPAAAVSAVCGNINQNTTEFHDTYHSIQSELQPPLPQRLLVRRQLHAEPVVHRQHRPARSACSTRLTARSRSARTRARTRS